MWLLCCIYIEDVEFWNCYYSVDVLAMVCSRMHRYVPRPYFSYDRYCLCMSSSFLTFVFCVDYDSHFFFFLRC
jgi:hypothetical protein